MCSYQEAVKCLAEKYIEAEYYAVGKDINKLDKKKLKEKVIDFISNEFDAIFNNFKKNLKQKGGN